MLDLADLKARLEAQLAAVAEAEAALARVHHLCGLPLPVERVDEPAERVLEAVAGSQGRCGSGPDRDAGQQMAMRICPGCGASFIKQAPAQKYCDEPCRVRRRNERALARKRARADAAWRVQTDRLRELHEKEGFVPNGEAGHATREENHGL
jgi:hypothetical protein